MFAQATHRPWPLPTGPWVMTQTWERLLFAHWQVEPHLIQSRIPAPLELDTFAGAAWMTMVPFRMNDIRFRLLPKIPGAYTFPQLNVRTYVTYQGKSGVYFFHIEADHRFAAWIARKWAYLPYDFANINWQEQNEHIHFTCQREHQPLFEASYKPTSPAEPTKADSLDRWLMERYCFYTTHHDTLYRGEIHHQPWLVQPAKVDIVHNAIFDLLQLNLAHVNPLFHYAQQLKIWAWPLSKCTT